PNSEAYNNRKNQANKNKPAKGSKNNDEHSDKSDSDSEDKPEQNADIKKKVKGHGRLGVDAYAGADIIDVPLEHLKPGDDCPDTDCDGRLYEMSNSGILLRITASPMANATRYNLQKLRCNLCEIIYTAEKPAGVGDKKYDTSFVAMLMINKYFMSVPFYRQENLQRYLGIPLPSSTQWELMAGSEKTLAKLYDAFIDDAAQAKGISFDDTKARVLEQIATDKKAAHKKDKKACYTTGFVSAHDDHLSYIFLTNNQTAGKDVSNILRRRDKNRPTPYLMCDALSANIPEGISKDLYILCYCLIHARRQFYELPDGYDDLADTVIRLIGKVYDNEDNTKSMTADERLQYHKEHSDPVMLQLKAHLDEKAHAFEPNSVPGRAIDYVVKRWTELSQFLRYKDVPIDTNIVERALKLVIQVRKSSMFYKTLKSAKIASYIQTALYSAAQNDINPYEYMRIILSHANAVEAQPNQWLPWTYQATLAALDEGKARQADDMVAGSP
ncbi:MAG: IS66 family transposase, partial [Hyphomicrobiaceae bacterium]|nr:IS66 family transposase [Hyphomicrobiaceae bacterium]